MSDKFFPELARRLKREGISTGPVEMERLPVLLDGQKVMAVAPGGTIFLMPETADTQPVVDAYDTVAGISAQVHEYTEAMTSAPPLNAVGLHEGFRLLAEFNGVVLAGQELEGTWGYKFVTWARSPDRTAVAHGHYYDGGDSYEAAKLDFACRAGLVQESRLYGAPAKASFSFRGERRDKEAQCGIPKGCSTWSGLCLDDEQLTEVYRCIAETLDSGYPITREREKTLATTMEQISASVDNLDERVSLSNQRELEAMEQHGPEMPEDIHNQGGMRFE